MWLGSWTHSLMWIFKLKLNSACCALLQLWICEWGSSSLICQYLEYCPGEPIKFITDLYSTNRYSRICVTQVGNQIGKNHVQSKSKKLGIYTCKNQTTHIARGGPKHSTGLSDMMAAMSFVDVVFFWTQTPAAMFDEVICEEPGCLSWLPNSVYRTLKRSI